MTTKYLYLYVIVATVLLILGAYKLIIEKQISYSIVGDLLPAFFLYYLAYKVYKEKKDDEIM